MALETTQELADAKEDEEELEALPHSTLRSRQKRIEELETMDPLAMVYAKTKGQATSLEKKRKLRR